MRWHSLLFPVLLLCLTLSTVAQGAVVTRTEERSGKDVMVIENDHAVFAVLPDPGGTVIEYTDKRTGVNHVAGGDYVLAGRLGFGWKDYHWLEAPDKLGKGVFTLPYKGEFREGKFADGRSYHAIYVTTEAEGRRFEREMRLADDSAELTTLIKVTNISSEPLRVQARWHTYSTLDDKLAKNSCILLPGLGGQARKNFIGSGWDHQYITSDPFWMAVNYKDRTGIWMTFNKEHNGMQITWTDYNHTRQTPQRGMYVAEPQPKAVLAQPGEFVRYDSTFYPFTAEDTAQTIPMGVLEDTQLQQRARSFLANVLPNLPEFGHYTMTPGEPPAGQNAKAPQVENRFSFSHRRRDRFALRPWGILDGMMAVPSVQDQTIRTRYYAKLFLSHGKPVNVAFRFRFIDAAGNIAREQIKKYTLNPGVTQEIDERDDISMQGLDDGLYSFVLDGLVDGEVQPIHTYIERRRLVGQARDASEARMAAIRTNPLKVRPFVDALYHQTWTTPTAGNAIIPIGVEDGSGVDRKAWPVRTGVPFAQGIIQQDTAFELLSPQGKPVPVQTRPMATWMDGSVKWLLIDFDADVPADSHVFYTLKTTANKPPAGELLAYESDHGPWIRGLDFKMGDNKVLGLFGPDDLWWEDHLGQRFLFKLQGENAGVIIEENSPTRAVIKATGWYLNPQGKHVAMGELRLEAYKGQRFVRLYHSVTFTGDPWTQELDTYGARFAFPKNTIQQVRMSVDGKTLTSQSFSLFQRNSEDVLYVIDGKDGRGQRSNGAVILQRTNDKPLAIQHVDFWQMAPKGLAYDADASTLTFQYWPKEAGAMSLLPREDGWIPNSSDSRAVAVGMSRVQEYVIDLDCPLEPAAMDAVYHEPVVAITPPKYLAQTKAMLHLSPYDPQRYMKIERAASDIIDFFINQQELFGWYGQWTFGGIPNFWRADEYRWYDFGRYAFILNEQDIVEVPWLCYLRSGDRKYLKFAIENTRHLMEVATIRWNPVWPNSVGFSRRHHECIWLGDGDTGHSMLDPFLDMYYATGYTPAGEAAARMAKGMTTVTGGAWRYIANPIAGLSRMYQDTQNPLYKQHADRIWNTLCFPDKNTWWMIDHGDRMAMWYAPLNPQCKELVDQWMADPATKDRFTGPDILTLRFLQTGEERYAQEAAKQVNPSMPISLTQHTLSALRAWVYAGESVAKVEAESKQAPNKP